MSEIAWFHAHWVFVAVAATGLVGIWGLVFAALRKDPGRPFVVAVGGAVASMLIQVVAGLMLYASGIRPLNGFHVFYGIVVVGTLSLAYVYRPQLARRPALSYGILLLFVMGLGLRAWSNVS